MNDTTQAACEVIARVRSQRPLIHHITNFVVMNATANITLCMGALPVMAHAPQEVEEMVGAASALVLNLGTLWPEQVEAMLLAGRRANQRWHSNCSGSGWSRCDPTANRKRSPLVEGTFDCDCARQPGRNCDVGGDGVQDSRC